MLMDARAEAQRAADATALAGADAFRDYPGRPEATDSARDYAMRVLHANTVYGKAIDTMGAKAPVVKNKAWGTRDHGRCQRGHDTDHPWTSRLDPATATGSGSG